MLPGSKAHMPLWTFLYARFWPPPFGPHTPELKDPWNACQICLLYNMSLEPKTFNVDWWYIPEVSMWLSLDATNANSFENLFWKIAIFPPQSSRLQLLYLLWQKACLIDLTCIFAVERTDSTWKKWFCSCYQDCVLPLPPAGRSPFCCCRWLPLSNDNDYSSSWEETVWAFNALYIYIHIYRMVIRSAFPFLFVLLWPASLPAFAVCGKVWTFSNFWWSRTKPPGSRIIWWKRLTIAVRIIFKAVV